MLAHPVVDKNTINYVDAELRDDGALERKPYLLRGGVILFDAAPLPTPSAVGQLLCQRQNQAKALRRLGQWQTMSGHHRREKGLGAHDLPGQTD